MADNSLTACYCFDSNNQQITWICDGSCACGTDINLDDMAKGKLNICDGY